MINKNDVFSHPKKFDQRRDNFLKIMLALWFYHWEKEREILTNFYITSFSLIKQGPAESVLSILDRSGSGASQHEWQRRVKEVTWKLKVIKNFLQIYLFRSVHPGSVDIQQFLVSWNETMGPPPRGWYRAKFQFDTNDNNNEVIKKSGDMGQTIRSKKNRRNN